MCVAAALLTIVGVDTAAGFWRWQRRIHMGRWSDFQHWQQAVDACTRRWLRHTPVVPKRDNDRYLLLDVLRGNRRNATIQSWQQAGLLMGLPNDDAERQRFIHSVIATDGGWRTAPRHVDAALLAYAVAEKDTLPAMRRVKMLIDKLKGEQSTIPYRATLPTKRYVDTVGFVAPFLYTYAALNDDDSAAGLAKAQIREYLDRLHPVIGFPPHSFDVATGAPSGVYDWGRGIGWLAIGLVESHRVLQRYPNVGTADDRQLIDDAIVNLCDNLLKYQHKDGGFGYFVCDASAFSEGSASVLAGLLILEAYFITDKTEYIEATTRLLTFLRSITQRNGALDMCQGDTKGVGMYSSRFGYMPFAQGMLSLLLKRYGGCKNG